MRKSPSCNVTHWQLEHNQQVRNGPLRIRMLPNVFDTKSALILSWNYEVIPCSLLKKLISLVEFAGHNLPLNFMISISKLGVVNPWISSKPSYRMRCWSKFYNSVVRWKLYCDCLVMDQLLKHHWLSDRKRITAPIFVQWERNSQLTHWGRVTHICVGNLTIIGSDNGLSPGRRQAIIWTNAGILLIGPFSGTNFSEILIGIQTFSFKKMHLKMSSAKWRPFCIGLNVFSLFDWTYLRCMSFCFLLETIRGLDYYVTNLSQFNPVSSKNVI